MARLVRGGQALLSGQPPGDVLAVYPPSSVVQYVPLSLLPGSLAGVLTRLGCVVILVWTVQTFGRSPEGRLQPWSLALLISPPAIDLVRIDQFNTALALLALVLAWRFLRNGRPLLAGLIAGIAMTRPLNAIPAGIALTGGRTRRQALGLLLGGLAFVGMTVVVACMWDGNMLHDVLTTGAHRPLVGIVGVVRSAFGIVGVAVMLAVVATLCWIVSAARRDRPLDAFVVALAISGLAVHVGGPYVAVFALPGLARLAATASPWWAVSTAFVYSALLAAVPLTSGWASGWAVQLAFTLTPLVLAWLPLWLLYRPRSAAERGFKHEPSFAGPPSRSESSPAPAHA